MSHDHLPQKLRQVAHFWSGLSFCGKGLSNGENVTLIRVVTGVLAVVVFITLIPNEKEGSSLTGWRGSEGGTRFVRRRARTGRK
jgi:hypothetical protein